MQLTHGNLNNNLICKGQLRKAKYPTHVAISTMFHPVRVKSFTKSGQCGGESNKTLQPIISLSATRSIALSQSCIMDDPSQQYAAVPHLHHAATLTLSSSNTRWNP